MYSLVVQPQVSCTLPPLISPRELQAGSAEPGGDDVVPASLDALPRSQQLICMVYF